MLTPIDIQNHTLRTSMSGYNKKETDSFLASVLESYEALFKENRDLKEKITSLSEGIQYYKQMENTLQKALILAEKTSSETQEAAKTQADTVIKDAQAKADLIIKDTEKETGSMKAEAERTSNEAKEKADAIIKEAERKASDITGEAERKAESLIKESEKKADTLIKEAEEKAGTLIKDAQAEADRTIWNSERKASDIQAEAQEGLDGIKTNTIKLVQDYEKYKEQYKKLAMSQLSLLESEEFILHVPDSSIPESQPVQKEPPVIEDVPAKESKTVIERDGKFSWNNSGYAAAREPEENVEEVKEDKIIAKASINNEDKNTNTGVDTDAGINNNTGTDKDTGEDTVGFTFIDPE